MKGSWCNNCEQQMKNIKNYCNIKGGKIISTVLSRTIDIQCQNKHIFTTTPKKIFSRWCRDCSKNYKQLLKDMIRKENEKIEEK